MKPWFFDLSIRLVQERGHRAIASQDHAGRIDNCYPLIESVECSLPLFRRELSLGLSMVEADKRFYDGHQNYRVCGLNKVCVGSTLQGIKLALIIQECR